MTLREKDQMMMSYSELKNFHQTTNKNLKGQQKVMEKNESNNTYIQS